MINTKVTSPEGLKALRESLFDLILRAPLVALTLLGDAIQVVEDPSCETMCTDGKNLYYSPAWVLKKGRRSISFDLVHEWCHIFGNHVGRIGARDREIWGIAVDVRVAHDALAIFHNVDPKWQLDADHVPAYQWAEHLTAERIYDELLQDAEKQKVSKMPSDLLFDGAPSGAGVAKQLSDQEFQTRFKASLLQAKILLDKKGVDIRKTYGDSVHNRLVEIEKNTVPWDLLLQGNLVGVLGEGRLSWVPPNLRLWPHVILPVQRKRKERDLLVAVDISGSVDAALLKRFASCIASAACRAEKTVVVTFDAVVRERVETRFPGQILKQLKFKTGSHGYTSTREVFEVADTLRPAAIVVLTDGHVELPETPHPIAHWILSPGGSRPPWGRCYEMAEAW